MLTTQEKIAAINSDPDIQAALVVLAKYASEKSNAGSTDKTEFDETTQAVEAQKAEAANNGGIPSDTSMSSADGSETVDPGVVPAANEPSVPSGNQSSLSPQLTQTSAEGSTPANADSGVEPSAIQGQEPMLEDPMASGMQAQDPLSFAAAIAQQFIGQEVYNAASAGHAPAIQLIAETAARLAVALSSTQQAQAPARGPMMTQDPNSVMAQDPAVAQDQATSQDQMVAQDPAMAKNPNTAPVTQDQNATAPAPRSAVEIAADQIIPEQPQVPVPASALATDLNAPKPSPEKLKE